jgi:hypothetical protein
MSEDMDIRMVMAEFNDIFCWGSGTVVTKPVDFHLCTWYVPDTVIGWFQYCIFQKVQGIALSSFKLGDSLRNIYSLTLFKPNNMKIIYSLLRYWNLNPSTVPYSKLQSSVIVIGDLQKRKVYHAPREAEIDVISSSRWFRWS